MGINKRLVESLIRCGAFDSLGVRRSQLIAVYEKVLESVMQERKRNVEGQVSLFSELESASDQAYHMLDLPDIEEFPKKMLLSMEKEMTGVYISGHPLDEYKDVLEGYHTTQDVLQLRNADENEIINGSVDLNLSEESTVVLGGIITDKKIKYTKNNSIMAFVTLEDLYGAIEVIVFPLVYSKYSSLLEEDKVVTIKGRISLREDEEPKIICNEVEPLTNEKSKLYLKIRSDMQPGIQNRIYEVLQKYKGNIPVYLYMESINKTFRSKPELWIRRDSELIKELSGLLGENCVKMI